MKEILEKFDDCDTFSLTGRISKYNFTISEEEYESKIKNLSYDEIEKFTEQYLIKYNITEEEFLNALYKVEERNKKY